MRCFFILSIDFKQLIMEKIRGRLASALKYLLLAISLSLLSLLAQSAFAQQEFGIAFFIVIAIGLIAYTYIRKRFTPLKFMVPGLILLTAFVLAPILYTVSMSTYNYKTGNIISKTDAIDKIKVLGVAPDAKNTTFDILLGTYEGKPAILATDSFNKKFYISTTSKIVKLAESQVKLNPDGVPLGADGFIAAENDVTAANAAISTKYYFDGDYYIQVENLTTGIVVKQNLIFDEATDTFRNITTGVVYKDNGTGNYVNPSDSQDFLEPGWRAPIWFKNFVSLFKDERVRNPLWSVTIWTFAFASITVLTQFAFGLLLALALNRKIFGRRIYRSILILPYAMPSIMSILIWGGMFDTEFGAINALFHTNIAWLLDSNFARFAVILVNLWLGFPYFYLVSSGALQAIPAELSEAAAIDGANSRQIFRKITLPLLLQILSPLLISSFAFNFNNFNLIYLLTGGGPRDTLGGEIAGSTDILISYTYQIAFGSNVQDLGLASAISFIIFIIVASVSLYGLKRSKVMENFS